MSTTRTISVLTGLTLFAAMILAGDAWAKEKLYPPYPNVWGRVLPVPTMGTIITSMTIYDNPDGDRLIEFAYRDRLRLKIDQLGTWRTTTFFGGQTREIDAVEAEKLFRSYRKTGLYKRSKVDKITFANGDVLVRGNRDFGGKRCWSNYSNTLVKKDSTSRIVFNKILFSYSDKPTRVEIWESCDIAGEKDHYFASINSTYPDLVPLEDETFLAVASELVIRFKPDLTSPFVDNRRLFLVDTTVIDRLVEDAYARPGQAIQNANDAIRDYLLTLKKESD